MVVQTVSPILFEDIMYMNKVLVAGILGLMLTACGQKKKLPLRLLLPAAGLLQLLWLPLRRGWLKLPCDCREELLPKLPQLSGRLPADGNTKAETAVSDAKAN